MSPLATLTTPTSGRSLTEPAAGAGGGSAGAGGEVATCDGSALLPAQATARTAVRLTMQIRTLVLREALDVRAVRIVPCSFTTRATLAP